MSKRLPVTVLLLSLGLQPILAAEKTDFASLGHEVVKLVRDNFMDAERGRAWAERHGDYAADIRNAGSFAVRTNDILAELETSHTRYYPRGSAGYWGLLAIFADFLEVGPVEYVSIGADVDNRDFVRRVLAGTPADEAGVLRGDRIMKVEDGSLARIDPFAEKAGVQIEILVERGRKKRAKLMVTPRRINPKEEWIEAQREGARLISREGVDVGYVPLYWCVGEEVTELMRELIAVRFADADAMILDFRDGWGGCNPDFLNFFNTVPPVLTLIDREGERRSSDPQWRKPLYVLINGGTRSGKEVVAYAVQREMLGVLVGERTAGFVVGGRPFLLSNGSVLYLAVMDAEVDGERLEGVGVAPDVEVPDKLDLAAGADPQLERAVDLAAEQCGAETPQ
jgi:carboxyl-terminal processing protease